jgi:RNA polymerase sigma factor for flagellar operon FliA
MNAERSPRTKRIGLSPSRQVLAQRYIPLARSLARPLRSGWPSHGDDFESAAYMALVEAAESFDPSRNIRFATFARHRIIGALRDAQRELIEQSRRWHGGETTADRPRPGASQVDARFVGIDPEPPVGEEIEHREAVELWLSRLPQKHAAACRQLYLDGKTQTEAAACLGFSQSRLSSMHREAIQMLQDAWYARHPEDAA